MRVRSVATVLACMAGWLVAGSAVTVAPAGAHGSLQNPASRIYTCQLEGAESPDTAACRAAVAAGGTQAIYDWPEVNQANAAGRHREIIPDGHLCSAGRDKYKGFDLARTDWPATTLPTTGSYTFTFLPTVKHRGSFQFYVTRNGYDPTVPLKWSDLEATPFATITNPDQYVITTPVPQGKTGRHLIYTIWQRSDSPEAFYACSDVIFGTDNTTPPPTNACGDAWSSIVAYVQNAKTSHNGHSWQARFWTRGDEPGTADPNWGPWADLGVCPATTVNTATMSATTGAATTGRTVVTGVRFMWPI